MHDSRTSLTDADRNWRRFVLFCVLFNSRFYYPVLAFFFLDLGLTATEYTLLNFVWALAIVFTDLPAGALADRIGRKPLVATAAAFMVLEGRGADRGEPLMVPDHCCDEARTEAPRHR